MSDKKSEKSTKRPATNFHTLTVDAIVKDLGTDLSKGLSSEKARELLGVHGPNELSKPEGESIWDKIKEQFEDLLVRILLAAAVISFVVSFFGKKNSRIFPRHSGDFFSHDIYLNRREE
jgi:magnesium-transporting ATPase (P-type)